jgi:hypothetical protein
MDNLQKLMIAMGIDSNIALSVLILLSLILIVITILYICVLFFLLRIRKEIIEMNQNIRSLYILHTQTKINGNKEVVSNEDKYIYDEKSSKDIKKFQLDDEDIKKLKTLGYDVE